jgi:flotillin
METIIIIGGALALIVVFVVVLVSRYYYQVPPSKVFVVYGSGGTRMVSNGGVFVWPIIQTHQTLDLTIMTIKTEKDEVYTISGVPIRLDWVAQVQIDGEEGAIQTAAKAFLDSTREEVRQVITETLSANFRAIVGQMTVENIHRDRDEFVQRVQDLASDDVAAMGVKIISMGIEEITDEEGYLQAMAAPQIAAVKRDAEIARAEADREARIKAAMARQQAEQAELDSQREILQQREALQLREVQVGREIGLAQADSDQEVQRRRALAVEQEQEAAVLVPARADRQSIEIRAEAERRRIEIEAEAQANATRQRAQADADAVEQQGRADAIALQVMKEAEAAGVRAEAEGVRARLLAEAEGEKAKLLAEAAGRREIASASAAEGEINLRQFVIEQVTQADIEKVRAVADAMGGLGNNVRIVQFGQGGNGSNGNGAHSTGNTLMDLLMNVPEVSQMFMAKVEALSDDDFESVLKRAAKLFNSLRDMNGAAALADETPTSDSTGSAADTDDEYTAPRYIQEEHDNT